MSQQNLANAAFVSALNLAAAAWEAVLDDPITVVLDVTFNALTGPVGQVLPVFETRPYDTVRQLIIDDAGPNEAIVDQLPTFAQLQTVLPDQTYTVSPSMDITRANLLALGVPANQLSTRPSQFDPLTPTDGIFELDSNTTFDFDPSDGITAGSTDLVAVAIHEIGHALGFTSSIVSIEAGNRNVNLRPLDMFRLEPGNGATDFTNSPRVLNPAAPDHVFYDGGIFSRAGITVAPRTVGDVPLSRGTSSDGFTASHWKDESLLPAGSQQIGVMDPSIIDGLRTQITLTDSRAFDLIGWNSVSRGTPADWRSIKLERYSNDRNVETVTESETLEQNSTPETAQPLGQLARKEGFDPLNQQLGGADDNVRLGFEVHGELSTTGDADVYAFTGIAGSEVWIDIDRTTHALDSIVELIDASGQVVVRSNDSFAEHRDQVPLFTQNSTVRAYTMQREIFSPGGSYADNPLDTAGDLYTTNPRDAGFRLILPGPLNTAQKYYVRIRSNSPNLDNVQGGQTRGAYQLQVRVRELDEIPGSTVRHANIRYASNGIEVIGSPGHSPLLGESGESTANNDLQPNAQDLGNLLRQERAHECVGRPERVGGRGLVPSGGRLVEYPEYRSQLGAAADKTASLIFDMDYAEGAGRPDTNLAIFDEQGRLMYLAQSSHVSDDQVAPNTGGGMNDLSRGSFGEFDPFLGPIHLPANTNETYYVAVSSHERLADELFQPYVRSRADFAHSPRRGRPRRQLVGALGCSGRDTALCPRNALRSAGPQRARRSLATQRRDAVRYGRHAIGYGRSAHRRT